MKVSEQIQAVMNDSELTVLRRNNYDLQKFLELIGDLTRAFNKASKLENPDFEEYKLSKLQDSCDCEELKGE